MNLSFNIVKQIWYFRATDMRGGARKRACEGYAVVKKEYDRLLPRSLRFSSVLSRGLSTYTIDNIFYR